MDLVIPLAVYTATEGYGWHCGDEFPQTAWENYRRLIGRLPDIDSGELPFGGAFSVPEGIVFYRCFVNRHADSKGRNALYLILGVIPQDAVAAVDFSILYQSPEFSGPITPFPTQMCYTGTPTEAASFALNAPFEKESNNPKLFRQMGDCFAHGGKLKFQVDGTILEPLFRISYQPPAPAKSATVMTTAAPVFVRQQDARPDDTDRPSLRQYQPLPSRRRPRIHILLGLLSSLLLILILIKSAGCLLAAPVAEPAVPQKTSGPEFAPKPAAEPLRTSPPPVPAVKKERSDAKK